MDLAEVDQRLTALPEQRRRLLLQRAGVDPDAVDGHEAGSAAPSNGSASGWGFPTNLPPRQRLVEYLEQQERAQQEAHAAAPQRRAMEDGQGGQQAQQRPLLLELLQQSRTFQSPDCADAMAEALGVAGLHKGLRGSLLYDAPPEQAVQAARTALKGALKAAWSQEALRQGVALAKAGDLEAALPYYDQSLQLDPSNADALVARGAALANRQQWQRASDDLEAALELQPEHSNARQYLGAIQSKAAERGVQLLPLEASRQATAAAAAATMQQEQQQREGEGGRAVDAEARQLQQLIEGRQADAAAAAAGGVHPHHRQGYKEGAVQHRHERRHSREASPHALHGRKRRRGSGSRSRSSSRSSGRRRRQRDSRSRSRSRSRRRSRERVSGSSSSSGSSGSDSDTEAAAARLAAAGEAGAAADGDGMDVTKALQIVTSHYKSRNVAWLATSWSGALTAARSTAAQCSQLGGVLRTQPAAWLLLRCSALHSMLLAATRSAALCTCAAKRCPCCHFSTRCLLPCLNCSAACRRSKREKHGKKHRSKKHKRQHHKKKHKRHKR